MDSAFVRYSADGTFFSEKAIQFVRTPVMGEVIYLPPDLYRVADVVHYWIGDDPIVELRIEPYGGATMVAPNV